MKKEINGMTQEQIKQEVSRIIADIPNGWDVAIFVFNSTSKEKSYYGFTGNVDDLIPELESFLSEFGDR